MSEQLLHSSAIDQCHMSRHADGADFRPTLDKGCDLSNGLPDAHLPGHAAIASRGRKRKHMFPSPSPPDLPNPMNINKRVRPSSLNIDMTSNFCISITEIVIVAPTDAPT